MIAWLAKEKAERKARANREEVILISPFEAQGYVSYFLCP